MYDILLLWLLQMTHLINADCESVEEEDEDKDEVENEESHQRLTL
jgi:hypothetical protein